MKLLAFDTSSSACSVAIYDADIKAPKQQQSGLHRILPLKQGQYVLPMIQELLSGYSLSINDVDAIAYGCGPGSFTGVRIASCVAQGIAYAARLPVISVSSMLTLAQTAFDQHAWRRVLVILDARMNQVYWACYEVGLEGLVYCVTEEMASDPKDVMPPISWHQNGGEWYGVGDGWGKYKSILEEVLEHMPTVIDDNILPTAISLALLAERKLGLKECLNAVDAQPVYLR